MTKWSVKYYFSSTQEGAQTSIEVAVSDRWEQVTGEYFSHCQISKCSKVAQDPDLAAGLWNKSSALVELDQYLHHDFLLWWYLFKCAILLQNSEEHFFVRESSKNRALSDFQRITNSTLGSRGRTVAKSERPMKKWIPLRHSFKMSPCWPIFM